MDIHEIRTKLPAEQPLFDPGLLSSIPPDAAALLENSHEWITYLLAESQRQEAQVANLKNQLAELHLALAEYANETGAGQLMWQNLELCLNVVRERKR